MVSASLSLDCSRLARRRRTSQPTTSRIPIKPSDATTTAIMILGFERDVGRLGGGVMSGVTDGDAVEDVVD